MTNVIISSISVSDDKWGDLVNANNLSFGFTTIIDAVKPPIVPYIQVNYRNANDVWGREHSVCIPLVVTSEKIQSLVKKISLMRTINVWAWSSLSLIVIIPTIHLIAMHAVIMSPAFSAIGAVFITGLALTFILPACGFIIGCIASSYAEQFLIDLKKELQQTQLLLPPSQKEALKPMSQALVLMTRSYANYLKPHFIKACREHDFDKAFKYRKFFLDYNCMPELSEEENELARWVFAFERRQHALAVANF